MRERRRDYELMFIISPLTSTDEGVAAIVEKVKHTIEVEGGTISTVNHSAPWGRRKLAYSIREYVSGEPSRRNFAEGFYVLLHFNLSAAKIIELERTIKLTDTILRHLVTLVENKGSRSPDSVPVESLADADDMMRDSDD